MLRLPEDTVGEWLGGHAAIIGGVAEAGIGLTVTVGTAGILSEIGVPLTTAGISLAAATTGGLAGGVAAGYGNGYIAGHSGWRLAGDTAIGGVAGAAGGAIGAGVAGQFCPAAIEGWIASGIAGGAAGGAIEGGYQGYQTGGWGGVAGGALNGAFTGGVIGGVGGLLGYGVFRGLGLLDGLACFVAGTQVAVELVDESDPQEYSETTPITLGTRTAYLTVSIEQIAAGTKILARDENDPLAALQKCVVEKVFCRLTFHLRILTLRMSDGRAQTIYTTDEHPAHESETQWTPAGELTVGDQLMEGSGGLATVVASRYEAHPEGIKVFNLRVAEAHTYLIRAEGFAGEPIWVHNSYGNTVKGKVYENIRASAVARDGEMAFFRAGETNGRQGGIDLGILADRSVILEEAKFQNRLQYDDFTAITDNLNGNVQEIIDSLDSIDNLSRDDKGLIRNTLQDFLDGNIPDNLSVRVSSGKYNIGPRLQNRISANTGGLPVTFV